MMKIPVISDLQGVLLKIAGIGAVCVSVFAFGCSHGEKIVEQKYQKRDTDAAIKAQQETIKGAERQAKIEDAKNLDMQRDIANRDAIIASLRKRAERLPGAAAAACAGTTGAELAKPDARFLIGEASESMKWQRLLTACYAREDNLRALLQPGAK